MHSIRYIACFMVTMALMTQTRTRRKVATQPCRIDSRSG